MNQDFSKQEEFVKEELAETHAGDYDASVDTMHDKVVADRDTNGVSASMERLGDLSGVQYDEDMDEISVEIHKDDN